MSELTIGKIEQLSGPKFEAKIVFETPIIVRELVAIDPYELTSLRADRIMFEAIMDGNWGLDDMGRDREDRYQVWGYAEDGFWELKATSGISFRDAISKAMGARGAK